MRPTFLRGLPLTRAEGPLRAGTTCALTADPSPTQLGLVALIGFHVWQLAFGWALWLWAIPMLVALVLLLQADRRPPTTPTTLRLASAKHPEDVPA